MSVFVKDVLILISFSDLGMIVTMHTVNIWMIDVLPPVLKRLKKAKSD